jgi:hypothetical protein
LLEACQALAAQASVDLAALDSVDLDSVDLDSVDLDSVDPVVLVAAHPALVALALVPLVVALADLAVRASVDLSVHVVLISKSGSIP